MHLLLASLVIAGVAVPPTSGQRIVSGDDAASFSIPSGGTVRSNDGTTDDAIRLDSLNRAEVLATAGTYIGYGYRIEPDGLAFDPPATLRITLDGDAWQPDTGGDLPVRRYNTSLGWVAIPAAVNTDARSVRAVLAESGTYALFLNTAPDEAGAPPPISQQQEPTTWMVAFGLAATAGRREQKRVMRPAVPRAPPLPGHSSRTAPSGRGRQASRGSRLSARTRR